MFPSGNQRLILRPQLASIENEEENIFIDALLGGSANVWVGAKRLLDGTWIWLDGKEFSYKNWAPKEPNNHQKMEDSILISWISDGKYKTSKPGLWNDASKGDTNGKLPDSTNFVQGFICQYKAF